MLDHGHDTRSWMAYKSEACLHITCIDSHPGLSDLSRRAILFQPIQSGSPQVVLWRETTRDWCWTMGMTQGLEWHTNQKLASISHTLIAIVASATSLDGQSYFNRCNQIRNFVLTGIRTCLIWFTTDLEIHPFCNADTMNWHHHRSGATLPSQVEKWPTNGGRKSRKKNLRGVGRDPVARGSPFAVACQSRKATK